MGSSGSPTGIRGSTVTGFVVDDQIDMIEIYISNPATFKFAPAFTNSWNACLFMFKKVVVAGIAEAEPMVAIDNRWVGGFQEHTPQLDNTSGAITAAANSIGISFSAGNYYIAVAGSGVNLVVGSSEFNCYPFGATFPGSTGLRTAECTYYLDSVDWLGTGPVGEWRFVPTGVSFVLADTCDLAAYVTPDSVQPINNTTAAGGGGYLPGGCSANSAIGHDVWFKVDPPCEGDFTVSTCGTINFDSVIVIYAGDCGCLVPIACNDDVSGCSSFSSRVTVQTTSMMPSLYIRVGSYGSGPGGSGTISFTCSTPPGPGDFNGDGLVNGEDLGSLLSNWSSP